MESTAHLSRSVTRSETLESTIGVPRIASAGEEGSSSLVDTWEGSRPPWDCFEVLGGDLDQ